MSVPDHRAVVDAVWNRGGHDLETKEGAGRFTEACALDLHALDQNWGHLEKPPNRTHVVGPDGRLHAVDVVLYRDGDSYATVDLIVHAGEPGAHLGWGVQENTAYTEADWYAPTGSAPQPPPVLTYPPYPGDQIGWQIGEPLFADYARAGQAPNPGMGVWFFRSAYDIATGEAPESAIARHRSEWCAILGIPVTP